MITKISLRQFQCYGCDCLHVKLSIRGSVHISGLVTLQDLMQISINRWNMYFMAIKNTITNDWIFSWNDMLYFLLVYSHILCWGTFAKEKKKKEKEKKGKSSLPLSLSVFIIVFFPPVNVIEIWMLYCVICKSNHKNFHVPFFFFFWKILKISKSPLLFWTLLVKNKNGTSVWLDFRAFTNLTKQPTVNRLKKVHYYKPKCTTSCTIDDGSWESELHGAAAVAVRYRIQSECDTHLHKRSRTRRYTICSHM